MVGKRTLELNPYHRIIINLKERIYKGESDKADKDLIDLLYQTALLQSGFDLDEPTKYAKKIHNVIELSLSLEEEEEEEKPTEISFKEGMEIKKGNSSMEQVD